MQEKHCYWGNLSGNFIPVMIAGLGPQERLTQTVTDATNITCLKMTYRKYICSNVLPAFLLINHCSNDFTVIACLLILELMRL